MYSVSQSFLDRLDDPHKRTHRFFRLPEGGADYSDKVLDFGRLRVRQYEGENISGAALILRLKNDSQEFNFLKTTKENIGKTGVVYTGFPDAGAGEYIARYRGFLEEVEFSDEERHVVNLIFNSKTQRAIERTIGSAPAPVSYTSQNWNPADLAWELLSVYGGMNPSKDVNNQDIDYNSYLAFKSISTELAFFLNGYFQGQTVSDALRLIGALTDCLIYGDTDGKIYFRKFIPSSNPVRTSYTDADGDFQAMRMRMDRRRLINKAVVWYGYNPITDLWVGSVTHENADSQTKYSLLEKQFDSDVVWHSNQLSASAFGERLIARYLEPLETVTFDTKRGTRSLIQQIGDDLEITHSHLGYTDKLFKLYEISGEISRNRFELVAEDLTSLNKNYFILDSSTNGVLDQNILF